ncbi:hypothetical protein GCM10010124_11340 [Pilimelia terevasa]|uniref:DUF4360 domain-containing protein n=1 Tax=Pilimelia terevasa TaxID=53372 RepID=A0A8J3BGX2_9ACTN|nr:DUF4360 domain-containing protein [Pilimelia terevasa]GGK20451.1 hypothetical protein GCM10010124_11340 [Pilimelia terevasa]
MVAVVTGGAPPAAQAGEAREDPGVTLEKFTHAGPGCPAGSADAAIADDKRSFAITYDQFIVGRNLTPPRAEELNCTLRLHIKAPPRARFALWKVWTHGLGRLSAGGKGALRVSYFYTGSRMPEPIDYGSPVSSDGRDQLFSKEYTVPDSELAWSECGVTRFLNVVTFLDVAQGADPNARAMLQLIGNDVVPGDPEPSGVELRTKTC